MDNKLIFNEETHQYLLDGNKLLSVTQLMKKHELSPSYFGVDEEVLKKAAEKGKIVHADIEMFIKEHEEGFTTELQNYIYYCANNGCRALASEMMVNDDLIAGTLDLIMQYPNEVNVIADIKTTSEIHYESVSWQLSIYKYLVEKQCGNVFNLNQEYGQVFHFDTKGYLNVADIKLKPIEEVLRLMECERANVKFVPAGMVDMAQELIKYESFITTIKFYEDMKAELEEKQEALKNQIMAEMKSRGIYKFQNDDVSIAYTPAKTSKTFDKDRFKEENPELYKEYETKDYNRKESLRITMRGKK